MLLSAPNENIVLLFYHFLPLFHHKICSIFVFEVMSMNGQTIFQKHCSALSYPNIQNTTEISHTFFHQYKISLSNSLYCQHPQELFHYACNPEWKWIILAQLPAKSKKSSQILTIQNIFGSSPRNSPLSSTKSSHGQIYKLFSWRPEL